MEKVKRALDIQRSAYSRIYNDIIETISLPDVDLIKVQGNLRLLDQKQEALNDLDRVLTDLLLNSEEDTAIISEEVQRADEYSSKYHELKLRVEKLCSDTNIAAVNSDSYIRKMKLPTIELRKFGGDLKDWLPFWSQFRRIHEDPAMRNEDKFQYLIQSTIPNSRARQLVESYPPNEENYSKALESLKNRFGRDDLLVEVYVRELLKLVLSNLNKTNKLRSFYDKIETQLRALETLGVTSDTCAAMLYPLVESCLNEDTIRVWQRSPLYDEGVTMKERLNNLMKFIKKEVENEERICLAVSGFDTGNKSKIASDISQKRSVLPTSSDLINRTLEKCIFCGDQHSSEECSKASTMPLSQKRKMLMEKGCCHSCLRFGHISRRCRMKVKCSYCQGHHVSVMCSKKEESHDTPSKQQNIETSLSNMIHNEVFLQTIVVQLKGEYNKREVRALIDTGSQKSYITKSAAEEMRYTPIRQEQVIHALFGGSTTEAITHSCYRIRLSDLQNDFACNFEVLDQLIICHNITSVRDGVWTRELESFGIKLTDTKNGPIDILIGADIAGKLFTGKKHELSCGLVAMQTLLGWTLMGKISSSTPVVNNYSSTVVSSMLSKDISISNLWKLDVLGISDPSDLKTSEENDKAIMNHFLENVKRSEDGRYEVCMPWVEGHPPLPSNFDMAYRRHNNVVRKLHSDGFFEDYQKVFDEWLQEEIIEEVPFSKIEECKTEGHYLPHHPVIKLSSATTKVRPVFDASAKEKNSPSLNHCLEKGINLIELIPSLFIGFRLSKIGVISDIRRAFLQIGLHSEDRDSLRFLWHNDNGGMIVYRHNRVVFGVNCSPFLLGAVIDLHLQKALEGQTPYSKSVITRLRKSFYVDNCVTSVDSLEDLHTFIDESNRVMKEAQFDLRGWEFSLLDDSSQVTSLSPVLGLMWNKNFDTLELCHDWFEMMNFEKVTKRIILSVAHRLFDPIGFSSPVTLCPKLLLQKAWALKTSWDTDVDEDIRDIFLRWIEELPLLSYLKIPRWFLRSSDSFNWSLHVFCDSSAEAYATAIFLRSEDKNKTTVQLVQAKSRVAPLKKLSIPRLELLAATIGARLAKTIVKSFDPNIPIRYWTDSSTVLSWIRNEEQWKPFVWNRVNEIRKLSNKDNWYFVPGEINPADLPSRGCSPKKLVEGKWWEGPSWLWKAESHWPNPIFVYDEETVNQEKRKSIISSLVCSKKDYTWYYHYFSEYDKIIRLIAWIKRFIQNCKSKDDRNRDVLTVPEIVDSENFIIKMIQEETFQGIDDPRLASLCPFIDDAGLIRIQTKISERNDCLDFRFPYVLPSKHEVVSRLILKEHVKNAHAGVQCLLSTLRERFWIIKGRRTIKAVISKCFICRRMQARNLGVPPISLPETRVRDAAVFEIVGVDLAGPLYIKTGKKVWITLYTCAVFRAVHLELVTSLSTDAFLQSFRRFVARRGRPHIIYSDNAKNFVGADNSLSDINWDRISDYGTIHKIIFRFIPPAAPWWGGWWERLVRTVKGVLRKVLKRTSLTLEEFSTVICDCEAVVNSRPLTYISEDPKDLVPLTPSMFLQEMKEIGVPDIDAVESTDLKRHYRYRMKLKEDLRKRFRREYLGQLSMFPRKKPKIEVLKVGDVVLIGNDNQKRTNWPLGRVDEMIAGRDGNCRLVKLKTAQGQILRPLQRLHLLEMDNGELDPRDFRRSVAEVGTSSKKQRVEEEIKKNPISRFGRKIKAPVRLDL